MHSFERISQALKYIDSHLAENISIDRLAGMFYMSPFYFHRTFSAIVGKAIADEWLLNNDKGYSLRLLNGKSYVVEFYDERFKGYDADSNVEIWVPIRK